MTEKSAVDSNPSTDLHPGTVRAAVPLAQWPDKKLLRIGELADLLGVQTHVLRFWLQQFRGIRAERSDSGRLLFSRPAAERLFKVRQLLYEQGYTIAGAKRALSETATPLAVAPTVAAPPPAELLQAAARLEQTSLAVDRLQAENRALAARLAAAEAAQVVAQAELAAVRARFANEWDELASQLGDLAADIRA
ncbi:MAG: MerR family transcriptional regulator [Deltaproteobacteria bacterium]|nr:MerR family transcriptional regulator [Deltaproteobacteria bacterium]